MRNPGLGPMIEPAPLSFQERWRLTQALTAGFEPAVWFSGREALERGLH
jgi:hypothetical protein